MTLHIAANHDIRTMHEEPAVAHIHFRTEDGMRNFIEDNRRSIKSLYERWTADWEPLLTITAAR